MTSRVQVGSHSDGKLNAELGIRYYKKLQKKDPNKIIVIDDTTNEEININQFLRSTIELANGMIRLGVKKGDTITIVSENNWKYLASIIAGFFVGATLNPLNHDYTSGELKHFIELCKPVIVFCSTKTKQNLLKLKNETAFSADHIIIYDAESDGETKYFNDILVTTADERTFEPAQVNPDDVALILTSSGTTGLPKCVMLTYANFASLLSYFGDAKGIDFHERDVTISYLPFFHIFGFGFGINSVYRECKQIIVKKFNPERFLKLIEDHAVTKFAAVAPILQFLATSPLIKQSDLSSIQEIYCGGTPIPKQLIEMVQKRLDINSICQLYGMTETTGAVTIMPKGALLNGSAGKVITNYMIKVCDVNSGQALPPNQTGELRFQGPGIMKGYLGNEEETKNSFDEEGFLKSGDLGYYDEDGFIYITDRLKEIIKYKGFQVSPVELENLLFQHPSVKDVAVAGLPDERAGEVPVAFVVKHPDRIVSEAELIRFVEENISVQKRLYGGVRFVDEIPKNASGKISRNKLKNLI